MAKKQPAKTRKRQFPKHLGHLVDRRDEANPREIDDRAKSGLSYSLAEFGDLSGITYNRQLDRLVTGHQRVTELHTKHGDLELRGEDGAHYLETPAGDRYPVRVVHWDEPKHRAANLAANNPALQGKFADTVNEYAGLLADSDAGKHLYDNLLLADIQGILDKHETTEETEEPPADDPPPKARHLAILITFDTAEDRAAALQELREDGYDCLPIETKGDATLAF